MTDQTYERQRAQRLQQEHAELDDPIVKAQLQLDRWWESQRAFEAELSDSYEVGGFRERRTRYGFTKHWRDPDFDTH